MADVRLPLRRLSIADPKVEAKASELLRLSRVRLCDGGLGQGELCRGAACVELACLALGLSVDTQLAAKCSGASPKVYAAAKATLQKLLGVAARAVPRDLCVQFGCARHEGAVKAALTAFKQRFVRRLPPAQQGYVDFSRPVFVAAAFYLTARKQRVAVDRTKLLGPLGVTAKEFAEVTASMMDLMPDMVGTEPRKRKATEEGEGGENVLLERIGGPDNKGDCSSGDEVEDEGQVGHRFNAKKQKQRDYEAWKEQQLGSSKQRKGAAQPKLTETKLRQAVLGFGGPPAAEAAGSRDCGGSGETAPPGDVRTALADKNE